MGPESVTMPPRCNRSLVSFPCFDFAMIRLHAFPQLARPVLLVGLLLGDGLCGGQRVLLQRLGGLQLARVEGLDSLTQLLLALLQGYHCRGQAKLTD